MILYSHSVVAGYASLPVSTGMYLLPTISD